MKRHQKDLIPEMQRPHVAALILAAGSSMRMDGLNKQFEDLGGIPVLAHAMLAFAASEWVDELLVVTRSEDIPIVLNLVRALDVGKMRSVVAGGATRQESALLGVRAVSKQTKYLAVHDGARPFVSQQTIADTVIDAIRFGAAAAAIPVVDTIKLADESGLVVQTPDRNRLFAMQTPQVFELEGYLRAASLAQESYTDDCQMLEAIGIPVRLTRGTQENIKITTPLDLIVARALLERMAHG